MSQKNLNKDKSKEPTSRLIESMDEISLAQRDGVQSVTETVMPSFDELAHLAQNNPQAFEKLRTQLCQQMIMAAPAHLQKRLQGLQFRIDNERKLSGSPLGACIRLSQMMNESLMQLHALLSNPEEYMAQRRNNSADVIAFKRA